MALVTTDPEFISFMAACPRSVMGDIGFFNWLNTLYTMATNAPTLSSISPSTIAHGAAATTITCTGTKFTLGAAAYSGATALVSTLVSATSLKAVIPASLLASAGSLSITVQNADGQTSGAQTFTVS